MENTRENLEKQINESILFTIDREVDIELFKKEENKFINDLTKLMKIIHGRNFDNIGLEIIVVAKRCIKNYKVEQGKFLNYYNFSLRYEIAKPRKKKTIKLKTFL